jgi:signal recognition particle subunit SRP54
MQQVRKLGSMSKIMGMLPGMGQFRDQLDNFDEREIDRIQAIIQSMTPAERANPKIIDGSRRARIAKGSGRQVSDVNNLVDRFFEARKMMSQMAGQMGIPGLGRKSSRKAKGGKGKKGKKGGQKGRGPTPPKTRNPLGMPAGLPDLSQMPPGLDELPPALADFDLSKLNFPGKN